MIEAHSPTERYGSNTAVDDGSFVVRPGKVTGLLGADGGEPTPVRTIRGADRPSRGTVNGRSYAEHWAPLRQSGVGAVWSSARGSGGWRCD
jgi:ABC-2 type transport system ATP-binding protein